LKLTTQASFLLFVCSVFLLISGVNLFSEGMFMDGLFYADISRNMSVGLGSFWTPYLSETQFPEFYEHPPLALGLQSLWFQLLGDSIYVERFYSLTTYVTTGVLISLIWKHLTGLAKYAWLPLLLWITVTDVSWAVANNMLENTMSIFVTLGVLFLLYAQDRSRLKWLIFAGISLSLGLLTKGFFCLYIWGLPFFYWLIVKKGNPGKVFLDTAILVAATIVPIALLYILWPDARLNMNTYFNKQVVGSIENVQTVNTRFAILFKFLENIIVPVLLVVVFYLLARAKTGLKNIPKHNIRMSGVLLAVVLSGILPIMISMKQRGFYILTVYPIFAVGLAFLIYPVVRPLVEKWSGKMKSFRVFSAVSLSLAVIAITVSLLQLGRVGRDYELVVDSKIIINEIGEQVTIGLCPDLSSKWNLYGYFSRYGFVSLDPRYPLQYKYLLTKDECKKLTITKKYTPVKLNTKAYKLYKRVENE